MLWSVARLHCAHCARAASTYEPVYYRRETYVWCLSEFTMLSLRSCCCCCPYSSLLCSIAKLNGNHDTPPWTLNAQTSRPLSFGCFQIIFFFLAFLFFIILRCFAVGSICRHLVLCLGRLINFLFCNHSRHDSCAFSVYSNSRHFLCSLGIIFIWILFWFSWLPHKHLGNLWDRERYYKIIVEGYLLLHKYIELIRNWCIYRIYLNVFATDTTDSLWPMLMSHSVRVHADDYYSRQAVYVIL